MNTPKLPPLPEPAMTQIDPFYPPESAKTERWFSADQMQVYALSAIAAQGLPDHCDPSSATYDLAAMVMSDCGHSSNNQRLLDRIAARIDKHVESALSSAPPAPQAKPQQIAKALRKHGLALVKTAAGYDVMKLGECVADGIKE